MKIGILTYHAVFNFGAVLQAHSSFQYLLHQGFQPIIIDYVPIELEEGYKRGHPPEQMEVHNRFIKENMVLTQKCRNIQDVAMAIKSNGIQAVLIGSDAVLQHRGLLSRMYLTKKGIRFTPKRSNLIFPNPFWGCFMDELKDPVPVSVMSASSQNTNYKLVRGPKKKQIAKALLSFTHLTVRDEWTRKMVQYFTGGKLKPDISPDPVFAFEQNVKNQPTEEEIRKKYNIRGKYLLFSFKNEQKTTREWLINCRNILAEKGIEAMYLTMPAGILFNDLPFKKISPPLEPIDWYALIKYSSGYIGENMHPIIVALHNAVPFFSFDDYGIVKFKYFVNERSSKIYHILNKAGFLDYYINTIGKSYSCPTPEKVIESILTFDKNKCREFSVNQQNEYNQVMRRLTRF